MADDNIGAQPNVDIMVQNMQSFTEEISKLPNVPALAEGAAIRNALLELTTQVRLLDNRVRQGFEETNRRFEETNRRLDGLNTRIIAK